MKQAIKCQNLLHLMPHREKMIWVDEVMEYSSDEAESGTTKATLIAEYPYFYQNQLIRSYYLEFLAQSYGFIKAAYFDGQKVTKLEKALIPMIDDYTFHHVNLKPGDVVYGKLETIRNLNPMFIIQGTVVDHNQNILAEARFKVFAAME
jgi:hypothetical protein